MKRRTGPSRPSWRGESSTPSRGQGQGEVPLQGQGSCGAQGGTYTEPLAYGSQLDLHTVMADWVSWSIDIKGHRTVSHSCDRLNACPVGAGRKESRA